jgi:hypothetical protein
VAETIGKERCGAQVTEVWAEREQARWPGLRSVSDYPLIVGNKEQESHSAWATIENFIKSYS